MIPAVHGTQRPMSDNNNKLASLGSPSRVSAVWTTTPVGSLTPPMPMAIENARDVYAPPGRPTHPEVVPVSANQRQLSRKMRPCSSTRRRQTHPATRPSTHARRGEYI